ncbi:MAG: Rpn family recombination-promoting nuclease/putative transposase [Candidatus Aminicenantes bacterium]|nr:Rpn family recombination-promoting nuclease/putative transposase [Candidatus Aminicenantes bacterium]
MVITRQKHIRFDWAVKKMLRSKANFGILEGFLSELIKEDIKIIDILESEGNKESANDKTNRVDMLVKDSKDQLIIVEIQNTRELDYFYKILYNTSKVVTEHIRVGEPYKYVKKVITVSVIYFDLGQGQDYVYYGGTYFKGIHRNDTLELSETQKELFKRQTVTAIYPEHYIIKVNDFDDIAKDSLDEWVYFLKNSDIKDEFKAKGLAEAREKLKEINLPEEELPAYRHFLDQLRDEASAADTIRFESEYGKRKAREEGLAEGREEGVKEGLLQVAVALKQNGVAVDLIIKSTGLSKKEIENL